MLPVWEQQRHETLTRSKGSATRWPGQRGWLGGQLEVEQFLEAQNQSQALFYGALHRAGWEKV